MTWVKMIAKTSRVAPVIELMMEPSGGLGSARPRTQEGRRMGEKGQDGGAGAQDGGSGGGGSTRQMQESMQPDETGSSALTDGSARASSSASG